MSGSTDGRWATKRVLVLYWHPGPEALRLAIHRHLHALDWCDGRYQILYYNAVDGAPAWLRRLDFDAVILHTTFLCLRWSHLFCLWKWKLRWVNDLASMKVAIPQDEYDHAEILDEWLYEMGVTVVFSNFGEHHRKLLYPIMQSRARFYKCFTGYIDERDAQRFRGRLRPPDARPLDIVYRAAHLPYWFGSHGQLKHRVGEVVSSRAPLRGLRCDIATGVTDVIVGPQWLEFLDSGRAVVGCESGSSVLDRRGEMRARILALCGGCFPPSFDEVSRSLPQGWDGYDFFAISPRHFEAVITKTCQVLVEGRYDGVLLPHVHYISLNRDFSNLDEVLDRVRDRSVVTEIVERAYKDIYESGLYSYRAFAELIDQAIEEGSDAKRTSRHQSATSPRRAVWLVQCAAARLSEQARRVRYRAAVRLTSSPLYWCLVRHPLVCLAKVYAAACLILSSGPVRNLFALYWRSRELRQKVPPGKLMMDLVMLRLLQLTAKGQVHQALPVRIDVDCREKEGELLFRAAPAGSSGMDGMAPASEAELHGYLKQVHPLKRLRWDHTAVGVQILYPVIGKKRVSFPVGANGVHEFHALTMLVRHHLVEAAAALAPANWK